MIHWMNKQLALPKNAAHDENRDGKDLCHQQRQGNVWAGKAKSLPPFFRDKHLNDEEGFSLTELMVVLVIIGILALLALPRFLNVVTKAKTSEAKVGLKMIHTLQQSHYFEYDNYAAALTTLHYQANPLVSEGGSARYQFSIESAAGNQYVALATAVVDFDKDGTFNVWEVNQEGVISERTPD